MAGPPAAEPRRPVDAAALTRAARRIAATDEAPWLHRDVGRRMAERLPAILRRPKRILDWWGRVGRCADLLSAAYPQARIDGVRPDWDPMPPAGREGSRWDILRRRRAAPTCRVAREVPAAEADLLWANMVPHFVADPLTLFRAWRRCIAPDGFLMFSTLGPGTLEALRALYDAEAWGPPMAALVDMHDLGDMLVQAGFADPVMDQEPIAVTWRDPEALLRDLHAIGGNAAPDRAAGLRTPRWRDRLIGALATCREGGGLIRLEFEVVYGHAFCGLPTVAAGPETSIDAESLRAMARTRGLSG